MASHPCHHTVALTAPSVCEAESSRPFPPELLCRFFVIEKRTVAQAPILTPTGVLVPEASLVAGVSLGVFLPSSPLIFLSIALPHLALVVWPPPCFSSSSPWAIIPGTLTVTCRLSAAKPCLSGCLPAGVQLMLHLGLLHLCPAVMSAGRS